MINGQKIKELRRLKNLTMDDLALQIGVKRQQIWNYENGRSNPTMDKLDQIAKIFEVDKAVLLDNSTSKATSDDWAQRLVDEMKAEIEELKKDKANLNELLKLALQANGNFPEGDSLVPLIIHRNQELITLRAA
jgi:transcriptional regulator with XRE-family HTH domain